MSDEHDRAADANNGADQVALANRLAELDGETLRRVLEESRILIRPGGQVIIENLTSDLLDVALALNPDAPEVQCHIESGGDDVARGDEEPDPAPAEALSSPTSDEEGA